MIAESNYLYFLHTKTINYQVDYEMKALRATRIIVGKTTINSTVNSLFLTHKENYGNQLKNS